MQFCWKHLSIDMNLSHCFLSCIPFCTFACVFGLTRVNEQMQAPWPGEVERYEAGLAGLFGQQGWLQGTSHSYIPLFLLLNFVLSYQAYSFLVSWLVMEKMLHFVLISFLLLQGFAVPKDEQEKVVKFTFNGQPAKMRHGSVVIAAITSCTNTSNPSVMLGAGLVAKKATELGLEVRFCIWCERVFQLPV